MTRSQLGLETLEDRCTPSVTQLPLVESLTLVAVDNDAGTATYTGTATHLGKVSVVQSLNPDFNFDEPVSPDNVFATYVKTAANGDTLSGDIYPDDPTNPFTTGYVTIEDGTGRFADATGVSDYIFSAGKKGALNVDIDGFICYDASSTSKQVGKPFRGSAEGTITSLSATGLTAFWTGTSSLIGSFTRTEELTFTGPTTFVGKMTWTAANGDQIFMDFDGTLAPYGDEGGVIATGSYTVTGGTGRFEGATGTATYEAIAAQVVVGGTTTVVFDGTLIY